MLHWDVDKKGLRQFLIASNKAGYAEGDSKKWIKEDDGSTTIPFEQGPWKSHDNFFGGEPYGGRVVVFHEEKPTWLMVYYGWVVEGTDPDQIYKILRGALKQMPESAPFRGPRHYEEGNFVYTNNWEGDLEQYSGEEQITKGDKLVYKATYLGGEVDKRQGL